MTTETQTTISAEYHKQWRIFFDCVNIQGCDTFDQFAQLIFFGNDEFLAHDQG